MSRAVVTRGVERCPGCRFAPRWCICAGQRPVACALAVDVLMHRKEAWRPTSTGLLMGRVVAGAMVHTYSQDLPVRPEQVVRAGHRLWVLHPQGEPVQAVGLGMGGGAGSEPVQALFLDGNWREAARMREAVEGWGRLVSVAAGLESRYRLRNQHAAGKFSTIEALILLLEAVGDPVAARALRVQFELHVYAGLRSRGAVDEAEAYVEGAVVSEELPEVLEALRRRRPNPAGIVGGVGWGARRAAGAGGGDTGARAEGEAGLGSTP